MTRRPQSPDEPPWDEPARTGQERRFEPSMEDRAWAVEVSARGGFLPPLKGPGLTPPSASKRRGKWGSK
jgi:hypothetical protein